MTCWLSLQPGLCLLHFPRPEDRPCLNRFFHNARNCSPTPNCPRTPTALPKTLTSAGGRLRLFTTPCEDGCFLTSSRGCCRGTFTRLSPTFLLSGNAISIAIIAG